MVVDAGRAQGGFPASPRRCLLDRERYEAQAMTDTAAPATIQVQGISLRKDEVLQAEAKEIESWFRNGIFLIIGMCFPIISMIVFSCLEGPQMWALGLPTAIGPFIACALGVAWKKPWGVVVETPTRYRTVCQAPKEEAEKIAAEIRSAI